MKEEFILDVRSVKKYFLLFIFIIILVYHRFAFFMTNCVFSSEGWGEGDGSPGAR